MCVSRPLCTFLIGTGENTCILVYINMSNFALNVRLKTSVHDSNWYRCEYMHTHRYMPNLHQMRNLCACFTPPCVCVFYAATSPYMHMHICTYAQVRTKRHSVSQNKQWLHVKQRLHHIFMHVYTHIHTYTRMHAYLRTYPHAYMQKKKIHAGAYYEAQYPAE